MECKAPVIEAVLKELAPIQERAAEYQKNPNLIKVILKEGREQARAIAKDTLKEVQKHMGLLSQ